MYEEKLSERAKKRKRDGGTKGWRDGETEGWRESKE